MAELRPEPEHMLDLFVVRTRARGEPEMDLPALAVHALEAPDDVLPVVLVDLLQRLERKPADQRALADRQAVEFAEDADAVLSDEVVRRVVAMSSSMVRTMRCAS
jgi:hypothetical protein